MSITTRRATIIAEAPRTIRCRAGIILSAIRKKVFRKEMQTEHLTMAEP